VAPRGLDAAARSGATGDSPCRNEPANDDHSAGSRTYRSLVVCRGGDQVTVLRLATGAVVDDAVAPGPLEGVYTHMLLAPDCSFRRSDMSRSKSRRWGSVASQPLLDGSAPVNPVGTSFSDTQSPDTRATTTRSCSLVHHEANDPDGSRVPRVPHGRPCVPWSGQSALHIGVHPVPMSF